MPGVMNRIPLSTAMLYLGFGLILGPMGFGLIRLEPFADSVLLERLTEIGVIISLFTAGMKLRLPLRDKLWWIPVRLATLSMTLTVGFIALAGVFLLKLPLGAAVLLGGILAPTDPVLASDVQVQHSRDDDRLRFSLTGEGGLNDGAGFPFVMLGLGLLGLHNLGDGGWRWIGVDVIWSIAAGLAIGAILGIGVGRVIIWLRQTYREAIGTDDFVALGLMAGAYGIALLCHSYGFLAVFAAGVALRHTERHLSNQAEREKRAQGEKPKTTEELPLQEVELDEKREELASDPEFAPTQMAREVLHFNEALERIVELGLVVLLGGMLTRATWTSDALWFAPLLFLVIRPISVWCGLLGRADLQSAKPYIAWFGLRGIGSLYYLFYAIEHHVPRPLADQLLALTFSVVAVSIVTHGISVTPLSKRYERATEETVSSTKL